jgi:P pilus assembly chaperone PapD
MRPLWCSLALLLAAQAAQAGLMLYPTRIVLDKHQRAAQVELTNNGTTPETYRINIVNRRMGENGELTAIQTPGPGEQFAEPLLRYSPRQVTIKPGDSQIVRILVRKPADLASGEYRSHLQFDRVPEVQDISSVEQAGQKTETAIGLKITALIGASIPVIVRQGETQASATLSDLALTWPTPTTTGTALTFQINRSGNRSVYGDLTVHFTPTGGQPLELAKAGGLAVYVPNPMRRVRMNLALPPGIAMVHGTLSLSFRERVDAGGRPIAEASLMLP